MQVAIGHVDARGIVLNLPTANGSTEQQIGVRLARGLKGVFTRDATSLAVRDVESEWIELDALALSFGSTTLRSRSEATLSQVRSRFEQVADGLKLQLATHALHTPELGIEVGNVLVQGEARMRDTCLTIDGPLGTLETAHARVEAFVLRIGELVVRAPEVAADALVIGWGGPSGFRLEAKRLASEEMFLEVGALRLSAKRVVIHGLVVHGPSVSFSHAALESAGLEVAFGPKETSKQKQPAKTRALRRSERLPGQKEVFDYNLLDGLSGSLNVDAVVDMTVPIIGQRRATHKLRLNVQDGSIDYRELEAGLSALEESLLDFSVRDSALVLERGIPLLPTRGFGKVLLYWELSPEDLALAHRRRVRLAVLPTVKLASDLAKENETRDKSTSSFALTRLGLENMDLKLTMNEIGTKAGSAIERLSFDNISAYGSLQYELKDEPRAGVMHAQIDALSTAISEIALGSMRASVHELKLDALREAALTFIALTPTHLRVEISGLALREAKLEPASSDGLEKAAAGE